MIKLSFKGIVIISIYTIGVVLSLLNVYGLSQQISPKVFFEDELRFEHDKSLSYDETIRLLEKGEDEAVYDYAKKATNVISQSLAHIHWERYDNRRFNQLVPIWENYFIFFMGVFSGIPEYERYHFADYKRSLNRGIGICGDASMIMSQVLNKEDIKNQIISFEKHVVTEVTFNENENKVFDPDYGVVIPYSIKQISDNPELVESSYIEKGYSLGEVEKLKRIYKSSYKSWDGVEHFITKKYYFEKLAYIFKWPFPIILLIAAYIIQTKKINN